ncbi:CBL-interacting protein kinase 2-like [Cynara cardunculus var. scolymus]|uniref:non-specific serine/threonine protein kinase n=1 Tax=Cynara cardunculus var. scolymus TaxID=59895 RepID=A0A124SCK8_CYNCS|nr:CBL-interacting protein kinase 2-like [Cynara cardunculus var. scolymus]KVH94121.1 Calcium/calmodulin-dependent/calcium-dependent protein kinase [Cynara cardunculus var. scolymus]
MDIRGSVLMERYELGRLLGQGTFAKVYYGRNLRTGQGVAIKVIDKEKVLRVGLVNQIKREISIMRLVKHPNILQLFEVMATKTKIYFALEYAKGGELFDKVSKGKLREPVARKYFQQLINAVDFCHSRGVYHRDLKPENLLLDENDNLKVSDFGLSALAESKHQDGLLHTTCGTPAYVAPEVINRKGYDGDKADIWSCGVILYVLLTGYLPFHDSNLMEMYRKIGKGDFKCPNWFQPDVRRLLSRMLDPNPAYRITIAKIKENPWFKKGTSVRKPRNEAENKELVLPMSSDGASGSSQEKQDVTRPPNLNAFDIIALSPGFDLTALFEEPRHRKEARFTSWRTAAIIISKLEEIAKLLKMKISKREAGLLKLEAMKEGKKGILSIDAEIFELTDSFHMVEVKKSNGDTLEYLKVLNEGLRPGLQDIVWTWEPEEPPPQQQPEQPVPPVPPLPSPQQDQLP